jgi:hypothetical protein
MLLCCRDERSDVSTQTPPSSHGSSDGVGRGCGGALRLRRCSTSGVESAGYTNTVDPERRLVDADHPAQRRGQTGVSSSLSDGQEGIGVALIRCEESSSRRLSRSRSLSVRRALALDSRFAPAHPRARVLTVNSRLRFGPPYDLVVDPDGTLTFPDRGRILQWRPGDAGARLFVTTPSTEIPALVRGQSGTLYAADLPGNRS